MSAYLIQVDTPVVATGELVSAARLEFTANFVAAVFAVVIVVATPMRRNAFAVGTDERERRTSVIRAVTFVFIGLIRAVRVAIAHSMNGNAMSTATRELRTGGTISRYRDAHLAVVSQLGVNRVGARALDSASRGRITDVRTSAMVVVTRIGT